MAALGEGRRAGEPGVGMPVLEKQGHDLQGHFSTEKYRHLELVAEVRLHQAGGGAMGSFLWGA